MGSLESVYGTSFSYRGGPPFFFLGLRRHEGTKWYEMSQHNMPVLTWFLPLALAHAAAAAPPLPGRSAALADATKVAISPLHFPSPGRG